MPRQTSSQFINFIEMSILMINIHLIRLVLIEVGNRGNKVCKNFRILVLTTSLDDMFKGRAETEDMDKFVPKFG